MSLQPIDLQTLFSQLSNVGREQAALRDGLIQNQAVVGNEIIRKSEEEQHTVPESEELPEGPENLHDEQEGSGAGSRRRKRKKGEPPREHPREVFREPYLGKNVDLSG
ncbi:MAG: hypothetical protein ACOCWS_02400 [Alkalispirochaetaceae bacterium]